MTSPVEGALELREALDESQARATALRIAIDEIADGGWSPTPPVQALATVRSIAVQAMLADDLAGGFSS